MTCPRCGTRMNGGVCPECGFPVNMVRRVNGVKVGGCRRSLRKR